MPKILPIKELRDTSKITELCASSNEPIFITKNGYGDMVIMSIDTYEKQLARAEIYDKIMAGRAQSDANTLIDGPSAMKGIKDKYGF